MPKSITRICKITILMSLLVIASSCTSSQTTHSSSRPTQWAAPIEKEGLGNFHKVSNDLYRGKQPTAEGIAQLKDMGIKTIIDLRDSHSDAAEIGDIKIKYESIPMVAWDPKKEDVVKFLKIVTDKNKLPAFVHCKRGADRTGFMVAAYRIAVEGWSKDAAIDEMTHGGYRYSPIWRELVTFIMELDFEKLKQEAGIAPKLSPAQNTSMW